MEITGFSSGCVTVPHRPPVPFPSYSSLASPSTAALSCTISQSSRATPVSSLPMKLQSSCSWRMCRSSIWGATSVRRACNFGTISLLLEFWPHLSEKQGKPMQKKRRNSSSNVGGVRAYMENANPVVKFLRKVQGALPVVGLLSRLASPVGGIGTDRVRFEEFCTRVGRNCAREDSEAFYEIAGRYGRSAKPPFVLIWCWAAAVGAGLLRSEDLLLGASRLRISYDIQYEVENFDLLMDEVTQRREKSGSKLPDVSMESRAEKALEAICKCCTGTTDITEEDAPFFATILKVVFPTADKDAIDSLVRARLYEPLIPTEVMDDEGMVSYEEDENEEDEGGEGDEGEDDEGEDDEGEEGEENEEDERGQEAGSQVAEKESQSMKEGVLQ